MGKAQSSKLVLMLVVIMLAVAVINEFALKQHSQKENAAAPAQYATVTLFPQNAKPLQIKAEVASTEEQITKGLMFRQSLADNEGMLFVYHDSAVRNFWMKNTPIPLDMIFIAENETIAKIHHAVPCTSDPCPLYNSGGPVKYVLEVNANLTADYGIEEGGKVKIIQ